VLYKKDSLPHILSPYQIGSILPFSFSPGSSCKQNCESSIQLDDDILIRVQSGKANPNVPDGLFLGDVDNSRVVSLAPKATYNGGFPSSGARD
jgi:hypothetical protein